MYYKNFWLERSSNFDDDFHPSAKSGHSVRKENRQKWAHTLFHPTRSVLVNFVAFFWYRLIGGVFQHHLVSIFFVNIKTMSVGVDATDTKFSILLFLMKIVSQLWTSLQPKVFVVHTSNFGYFSKKYLALLCQILVFIRLQLWSV